MMNRIWFRTDLGQMEKFVALALADTADDFGECYPAVATIALKCSCSERSVQNAIKSLCERGFLKKIERQNHSNLYEFQLDALPHTERPRRQKERRFAETRTGESPAPVTRSTGESGALTGESRSMTGESPAPRTVIEPSEEQDSSPTPNGVGPLQPENEIDLFGEWAETIDTRRAEPSLAEHVESRWAALKAKHPGIQGIRKIDDGLKHQLEVRAKQHAIEGQRPHEVWNEIFDQIDRSSFLQGRAPPGKDRAAPFKLSLAWLVNVNNFRKVIGGRYDDDDRSTEISAATGRRLTPGEQAVHAAVSRIRGVGEPATDRRDQRTHIRTIEGSFERRA